MTPNIIKSLHVKAGEMEKYLSDPKRRNNFRKDVYTIHSVEPLTDCSAAIVMRRNNKERGPQLLALFWLFQLGADDDPFWHWIAPKHPHLNGTQRLDDLLQKVEAYNHDKRQSDDMVAD